MRRKLALSYEEIIRLYTVEHLTCEQIGKRAGVTRQTIYQVLCRRGITSKQGEHVQATCDYCSTKFDMFRGRWKKSSKHVCSAEHYYAALGQSGYKPWRQGQRLARAIVAQHFDLQPEHIVHHEDRDNKNNDRSNLRVFASQADHMAYHRGRKITPLWDGSIV